MSSPIKAWRDQKKITDFLNIKGKIISVSLVRVPPQGFSSDAPYAVAVVQTEDGKRAFGQLTDLGNKNPAIGDQVEAVYRRQKKPDTEGVIYYGIKFKLIN